MKISRKGHEDNGISAQSNWNRAAEVTTVGTKIKIL
jgi:hypothetical protein